MRMKKTFILVNDHDEASPLLQDQDDDEWDAQKSTEQFNVVRRVYEQDTLNKDADYQVPKRKLGQQCKKAVRGCGFGDCCLGSLPIMRWLPKYNIKRDLLGDIVSGLTVAIMHIPQGMAYALLAEVPPIVGLYMAFFPTLIYVIFGTSPHVSMGTFAIVCLMAGKVVINHATLPDANITMAMNLTEPDIAGHPIYSPIQVLCAVTFAVGLIQTSMWILRLGAVSTLLSEPLVSGFTTGAAIMVMASQLKDLFGITLTKTSGNYKVPITVVKVCRGLPLTNLVALAMSCVTCLIIALNNELLKPWASKRCRVPIPIELIAIVLGTLVSMFIDLHGNYGLTLVGDIPTGIPVPEVPPLELLGKIAVDSVTITMVSYTISMSMALIFAAKDKYEVEPNQELLALGASNIFGSFFMCAPMCASLSRSYIQYQAGAKTLLTTVISSLLILLVLLWVGPFFESLPRCVLASIIVVSLKGMVMQAKDFRRFWKLSKLDGIVWMATFLSTMFINIDIGLMVGICCSVGALFVRSQRPYTCLLGAMPKTDLYLDVKRYRAAQELPGIKIFHYCGGLNFATKNLFRSTLYRKVGYLRPVNPPPSPPTDEDNNLTPTDGAYEWDATIAQRVKCVIIDASALSYVDAPGIRTLVTVEHELHSSDIYILLAGPNGPVLEMIDNYNKLESESLHLLTFPTVHDAVVHYQSKLVGKGKANKNIAIAD